MIATVVVPVIRCGPPPEGMERTVYHAVAWFALLVVIVCIVELVAMEFWGDTLSWRIKRWWHRRHESDRR